MNHGEGDVGESAQPGLWFNERLASENCNDCGDNDEAEYNEEDYEPDSDFHENNDGYEGDSDDEPDCISKLLHKKSRKARRRTASSARSGT